MGEGSILNAFTREGYVHAVWRDERGSRVVRRVCPEQVSSFVLANDEVVKAAANLRNSKLIAGMSRKGDWFRFDWRFAPWDRDKLKGLVQYFEQLGSPVKEADAPADLRWMIDSGVTIAKPKRCYLDIETDSRVSFDDAPRLARILVIAIVDESGNSWSYTLDSATDAAERKLLLDAFAKLDEFDQVCAWNGERFDFPMIRARAKRYGIKFDFDLLLWVDHLVLFKRLNMQVAESGEEKQSFALDSVAKSLLGMGKLDGVHGSQAWEFWEAGGEKREELTRYCVRDTDLMRLVEAKTGYLELMQTLAEVCGIRPDTNAMHPTRQIQGFVLRLGNERGEHFPTRIFDEEDREANDTFLGAYVMQPKCSGVVENVHVADFSGMYPSIVRSWNMSVETCAEEEPDDDLGWGLTHEALPAAKVAPKAVPAGHCRAPLTGVLFRNDPDGLIAFAMGELVRMRKYWNDLKASFEPGTSEWKDADRRSTAYKVAANSFYGVLGNRFSRFYRREVAESVSTTGKWLLLKTIEAAEEFGCLVIYADTDSIFVTGIDSERFASFVAWANAELYPRLLREQGCTRNFVKLDYQESFSRIVFTSAKRYAACFSIYKGKEVSPNSKLEIKGLEYKRGDSARLARELQSEVVDLIVKNAVHDAERVAGSVLAMRARVLEGDLPLGDVSTSKTLSKPIDEYDGNLPQVRIARAMRAAGRDVRQGTKIAYVVTNGRKSPMEVISAEDYDGKCDRDYLWGNLVYPPTQRFLESAFPEYDWKQFEKVEAPKAQLTLACVQALIGESKREREHAKEIDNSGNVTRKRRSAKGIGSDSTATASAARTKRNRTVH